MAYTHDDACEKVGVDPKRIQRIATRIEKAVSELREMNCIVFGGSGFGTIRFDPGAGEKTFILAECGAWFDGGDGSTREDENGLLRGE